MRKTVVLLLTSLLLASLPVQGGHVANPAPEGESLTRVVHDCAEDADVAANGNDLSSVWVGTGVRPFDHDDDGTVDETLRVVLVTVVMAGRTPIGADAPVRLDVQMEVDNNVLNTVLEDPSDDWQDATTLLYVSGESNLEPLGWAVREGADAEGATPDPRGHRVVELQYRFADIFSPGSDPPPDDLVIEGKWVVESSHDDDGDDAFTTADVMPGDDPACPGQNDDSPVLVPDEPEVTGITATPDENVDRRPKTKVKFTAQMALGGGDGERDGYTYAWTFTNGDHEVTSSAAEPEVRFPFLEDVDVTLVVTDDLGESTPLFSATDVIEFVNLDPIADFSIQDNKVPTPGASVTFTDRSFDPEGDSIDSWSWDFGDGSDGKTARNPQHAFDAVGTYDVKLTVTDQHGADDTHTLRVFVCEEVAGSGCKPPNAGPQASFLPSDTQVTQGDTVTFTDTSTDRDGTIASWSWDFGDGGSSTEQDPEHTFEETGTFHVTLTVTDDGGLEGVRAIPIRVSLADPDDAPDNATLLPAPLAAFTVDPEQPVVGEEVRFRDATSSQTEITRWTWFFGDGEVGEGRDVTHTYEESGTFRVRLTVTDERGVRDTTQQTVVVGSPEPEEDAPGLPLVLLLAGLAGAAVVARRRH